MSSSIPVARDALENMLLAKVAIPGNTLAEVGTEGSPGHREAVQITYGPPEELERDEVVGILGVEDITTEYAGIGAQAHFDERYAIHVRIKVHNPLCEGTPEEVRALDVRAWAIYEEVRATVAGNQTLNQALGADGWAIVSNAGDRDTTETPAPAVGPDGRTRVGWVAFIPLRVACKARIA
jgi:hypothetical protein